MKLSIILATRNRRDWLPNAIASVLRQHDPAWELCILDNGEPVADLVPDDPRIVYRQSPASGPADAFEQARLLASGDVVMPMGDDDTLYPDAVGTILERIGDAAWGYAQTDFVRGDQVAFVLGAPWSIEAFRTHFYIGGAVFWRRELPEFAGGGFDPAWDGVADYDLYLRFAELADPLYIPKVLYRYTEWAGTDSLVRAENARVKSELLHQRPWARRAA